MPERDHQDHVNRPAKSSVSRLWSYPSSEMLELAHCAFRDTRYATPDLSGRVLDKEWLHLHSVTDSVLQERPPLDHVLEES
jgi:hypothetical protein